MRIKNASSGLSFVHLESIVLGYAVFCLQQAGRQGRSCSGSSHSPQDLAVPCYAACIEQLQPAMQCLQPQLQPCQQQLLWTARFLMIPRHCRHKGLGGLWSSSSSGTCDSKNSLSFHPKYGRFGMGEMWTFSLRKPHTSICIESLMRARLSSCFCLLWWRLWRSAAPHSCLLVPLITK